MNKAAIDKAVQAGKTVYCNGGKKFKGKKVGTPDTATPAIPLDKSEKSDKDKGSTGHK